MLHVTRLAPANVSFMREPHVQKGRSPVGRLKKRLLAACRWRLVCGFESLLCPFFHRFSFDPVPDRSFPDFTIVRVLKTTLTPSVRVWLLTTQSRRGGDDVTWLRFTSRWYDSDSRGRCPTQTLYQWSISTATDTNLCEQCIRDVL